MESGVECLEEMPRESVFSVYMQCVLSHKLSYAFSLILLEAKDRQLAVSFMCYACHYAVLLEQLASLWCSCMIPFSFIRICVEESLLLRR